MASTLGGTRKVIPDKRWRRVLQLRYTRLSVSLFTIPFPYLWQDLSALKKKSRKFTTIRRIESDDQQIKTLYTKATWGEAQVSILQGLLKITGVRIIDLELQAEDAEFRLERCECGWIHDSARI
nr:hypothetical protein [Tanacetum cinerariifolium]